MAACIRLAAAVMAVLGGALPGAWAAGSPEAAPKSPALADCPSDEACARRASGGNANSFLPVGRVSPGTVSFHKLGGVCGNGEEAYYGYYEPSVLTHPKKFFVELMGGAVCFNKTSCNDSWLRRWMSITRYLKEKGNLPDATIDMLKSGFNLPLSTWKSMRPGYVPDGQTPHPMDGRRGLYFVTCTGDISMGRHTVNYDGETANHHGGMNFKMLLDHVKADIPDIEDFAIFGGSGGGVGSAAWGGEIANIWPAANVTVLVDSGFHMMPGSDFFNFFWDNVAWSPGPGGDNAFRHNNVSIPIFDWREEYSIANEIKSKAGRLRIAYLACDEDYIVANDRALMGQYSAFNGSSIKQKDEMWALVTNLHKCTSPGMVYTYISHCTDHHITRHDFPANADLPGTITAKLFVERFFAHEAPDPTNPDQAHFWFEQHDVASEGGPCAAPSTTEAPSTAAATTQATTQAPSSPSPTEAPVVVNGALPSRVGLLTALGLLVGVSVK